jgi:membrane-associated phospholipid phosphatase
MSGLGGVDSTKTGLAARSTAALGAKPLFRTLPHEWAFGAFLLSMVLRLAFNGHALNPYTALFLALFIGGIGLCALTSLHPSRLRWTLRLLWYPSIMGVSFYALAGAIPLLDMPAADARLAAWDMRLLGQPAAEFFTSTQSARLTDFMAVAYCLFFFYLILGPAHYGLRDTPRFRACMVGLFTLYALGLTGYTVLPATDPLYTVNFSATLPESPFAEALLTAISGAGNGFDVFPSIHVAVTLYLLVFDFLNFRRRFWLLLLPCCLLWVSTVYLRYHYFVDVLAGVAVAVVGLATASAYQRSRLALAIDAAARRADSATGSERSVHARR